MVPWARAGVGLSVRAQTHVPGGNGNALHVDGVGGWVCTCVETH